MLGESFQNSAMDGFNAVTTNMLRDDISARRGGERIRVAAKVTIWPANPADRKHGCMKGVCRDISAEGFGAILSESPRPGEVFWVELGLENVGIAPLFARCMRCRFIKEDAYETGFTFFTPQSISELVKHTQDADNSIELV